MEKNKERKIIPNRKDIKKRGKTLWNKGILGGSKGLWGRVKYTEWENVLSTNGAVIEGRRERGGKGGKGGITT